MGLVHGAQVGTNGNFDHVVEADGLQGCLELAGGGQAAERILHEYEVALNTVILAEQDELTEPIRAVIASVLGLDTTSLQIVNRPPTRSKPIYMKVWEARKADGLDYDPEDERQQAFLSEITKYNIRSIE